MTPARKRNLIRAPFVICVRAPILFPFWLLSGLGRIAEDVGQAISETLPGFEFEQRRSTGPHRRTGGEVND